MRWHQILCEYDLLGTCVGSDGYPTFRDHNYILLLRLSRLNLSAEAVDGCTCLVQTTASLLDVEFHGGDLALVGEGVDDFLRELRLEVLDLQFHHGTGFV